MVNHDTIQGMDERAGTDGNLARAAEGVFATPFRGGPETALADAVAEFGPEYQIEANEFCYVAVRRPTATRQEVIAGRTPGELLAKLRAERDDPS